MNMTCPCVQVWPDVGHVDKVIRELERRGKIRYQYHSLSSGSGPYCLRSEHCGLASTDP